MTLHTFCARHNSNMTSGINWVSLTLLDVHWWVHQAWQGAQNTAGTHIANCNAPRAQLLIVPYSF